jgi:hypothetical protein
MEASKQQGPIEKAAAEAEKPAAVVEKPATAAVTTEKAAMMLKFVAGDTARYRVIMEGQRKVKWEGTVPDKPSFQSGQNVSRAEITFTQKIRSVDGSGNATAVITIDKLKYVSKIKESTILDFDSLRAQDANTAMAKLIGQSYTIELTPAGQVSRIVDVNSAVAAVKGNSPAQKAAMKLLEPEVIKDRHGTLHLPAAEESTINTGESWKNSKTFSFGWMGPVSYERIYTLRGVDNKKATVEMEAVPTTAGQDNQTTSRIAKSFDNKGKYKGSLEFDSNSGQLEKYSEELEIEWLAAKPSDEKAEAEPTALTMSASRFYSIEKIK